MVTNKYYKSLKSVYANGNCLFYCALNVGDEDATDGGDLILLPK